MYTDLRHAGMRVRIVAIGAVHAVMGVDRRMPGHRRRAVMARQTQLAPRLLQNLPVRIVASRAIEPVLSANLVRPGNLLKLLHVAVAIVADPRRNRAEVLRASLQRRQVLRRPLVSLGAGRVAAGRRLHRRDQRDRRQTLDRRCRRPRRYRRLERRGNHRRAAAVVHRALPGVVVAGVPGGTL